MDYLDSNVLSSHGILELPERPPWDTRSITEPESISGRKAAKILSAKWNKWTDQMEHIYRVMHKESESLDLNDEDYIGLIALFSNHPARPEIPAGETFDLGREDEGLDWIRIPLFELLMSWESYGDVLERTFKDFAKALSGSKMRPGGAQEMMEKDDGDLDISKLSLTAGQSTVSCMRGILGSMIGPGHSFHAPSRIEAEEFQEDGSGNESSEESATDSSSDNPQSLEIVDLTAGIEEMEVGEMEDEDEDQEMEMED